MRILERHEIQPYEVALVHWENEEINYTVREYVNAHHVMFDLKHQAFCRFVSDWKILSFRGNTKLERGNFILSDQMEPQEAVLEKFAFSNALCLSGERLRWHVLLCFVPSTSTDYWLFVLQWSSPYGRFCWTTLSNQFKQFQRYGEHVTMQRDENICHVNVCGWLIDWIDCHFCLPADTEVWQESEVVLWWGDEEDRWALHTKVKLVLRNEQIYIVSCVLLSLLNKCSMYCICIWSKCRRSAG